MVGENKSECVYKRIVASFEPVWGGGEVGAVGVETLRRMVGEEKIEKKRRRE